MRLAAVLVVAACGADPSLHVVVEHPSGLPVATTIVTVYESPTLTCADVAFQRIREADLVPLVVAEETIAASGAVTGSLSDISRVDNKVIVARGYDAAGNPLTGGCAEKGEVTGRATVSIQTMELVTVSVVPPDPADPDPLRAVVAATDSGGQGVGGRRVGWIVYGPAGSEPASASLTQILDDSTWIPTGAACTKNGPAAVHPVPPSTVGGYAVQLLVEWAQAVPAQYTSLTSANLGFGTTVNPPGSTTTKSNRFCAIRINGSTRRLVCLDGVVAREYAVAVNGGSGSLMQTNTQTLVVEPRVVIAVPNGADRDVYAVSTRGFIVPLFGAPPANNATPICAPAPATCDPQVEDAIAVPACGTQPGKIILRLSATGPGQLVQMSARGGDLAAFPAPIPPTPPGTIALLDNAGCVDRFEGGGTSSQRQVITYHLGVRNALGEFVAGLSRAAYGCTATQCMHNELLPGAGVAFVDGRMVVSSIDATGVVLVQVVMAPDATDRDRLVERARYPAANIPDRLVAGQLDGDTEADLFWNMSARRGATFEIAYARQVNGQPLEALSPIQSFDVADVLAGDLTGSGKDVLVFTQSTALAASAGVAVVPVHVPATIPASNPDTGCP